jgi:O-antigen/teichoic acid export membrane protein
MLVRSLGAQWLAIGFVGLVSLGVSVLIARTLGPDRFGVYAIALSSGALIAILIDGGLSRLLQRERVRATVSLTEVVPILPRLAYGHAITATLILSVLAVVIFPKYALTMLAAIWFFGITVLNQYGFSILRGDGRLVKDASWQIVNRTATAACIGFAVFAGATNPWEMLVAQFVGAAVFGFLIMRYLHIRPLFGISPIVYRAMLPFVWLDLATALYFRADMVLFQILKIPKFEAGKYGVSYRLIEAVILFSAPVGLLLFRRFRRDSILPKQMVKKMLPVLIGAILVGAGLAVFLWIFGDDIIDLAYGPAYRGAGALLVVLGFALVFILPNGVLNQAALALGLERWFAISASIAAIVNIVSNLLLIPIYGAIAAAWVTVLTEATLGVCMAVGVVVGSRRREVDRGNSV